MLINFHFTFVYSGSSTLPYKKSLNLTRLRSASPRQSRENCAVLLIGLRRLKSKATGRLASAQNVIGLKMKKTQIASFVLLLYCFIFGDAGWTDSSTKQAHCPLLFGMTQSDETCSFFVSGWEYHIDSKGRGYRLKDQTVREDFALTINENDYIEKIQFAVHEEDLILLFGVTDGDGAAGGIVRLDGKSLSIKWSVWIPAFNLSIGTVDSGFLYQAGIGFVSKIDLNSGKYVWKYDDLYDHVLGSFNAFEKPVIEDKVVIFREIKQPVATYDKPREIHVNIETGKITITN